MKRKALVMAVATTLLWSGSYILNKLAFQGGIGPLTLSGLRYLLASLFLFCLGGRTKAEQGKKLPLYVIVVLGVLGYAIAQGLQYIGQSYLTPTQSSLFLSVGNTLLVVIVDRLWLRENQTKSDLIKLVFLIAGILLYYYPWGDGSLSVVGMSFMLLSSIGYAVHMTITRRIMVKKQANPKSLVGQTMLIGSMVMLAVGLPLEGLPVITLRLLLILMYLSLVSGALGFYLWTRSQQELTAFESSSINNLMLIEIALMDIVFFKRSFSAIQVIAIVVVFGTIVWIQ
ncbi:MAG: DMT family transporter, partial [Firmicutes bacterium]|nr:DMT family transporter [Bacillota bacterium]